MNIDLELYKVFYIVAKNKHMTKASEELHISQPAISQSIKKLEDQLGGTLFLRSNKGMELTEEGKMFYEYVKGALELINNAENEFTSFKDLTKGEIKIGCSTTLTKLILMDALKEFHKEYPNININITNNLTSNLINDLKLGKLDFVIFNESNIKETNLLSKNLNFIVFSSESINLFTTMPVPYLQEHLLPFPTIPDLYNGFHSMHYKAPAILSYLETN